MAREITPESLPQKLVPVEKPRRRRTFFHFRALIPRKHPRLVLMTLIPVVFGTALFFEARTSEFEARILSAMAARLSYHVGPGASPQTAFPSGGPFNEARGYADLPKFAEHLRGAGFRIAAQARLSPLMQRLARWKITPPFSEPAVVGLTVRGDDGAMLYDAARRQRAFDNYNDIPPMVVKALLFVENRELDDSEASTRNPVVDWGRLGKAGLLYAGHKMGLPLPVEGGSTLATQIEKFRYADGGRTNSALDKLRQMVSASLRVYKSGTDTREQRRQIVLDYMNSVPLSAATGYGEVYGIGNGLYAWFGIDLNDARTVLMNTASDADSNQNREWILKHMLALICAARAPSYYLLENHQALEDRVNFYTRQLQAEGAISTETARGIEAAPLEFLPHAPAPAPVAYVQRKAVNAFRTHLMKSIGTSDLYTLDRLHLDAATTLNAGLQHKVLDLFDKLKDPAFVDAQGLREKYLFSRGDPAQVTYSFTLFERTPTGNVLRVQADTLNQPFDLNEGMKLELGSTAKMRTLAHYLELVCSLYREFYGMGPAALQAEIKSARDPITQWTAQTIAANPGIELPALLGQAMDRDYSGNPGEAFFTGGGLHVFQNFDPDENGRRYTLREGLAQSVNLVYIRLMRDLVRFHEARLPYDPQAVLNDPENPVRQKMLQEIADKEATDALYRAYTAYKGLDAQAIVQKILGSRSASPRQLAMLYFAWYPGADSDMFARWLLWRGVIVSTDEAARLFKSYDPARLTISDYGYLLDRHPLDVWTAGQMAANPEVSWSTLLDRSATARQISSQWLFKIRNRRPQDLRLRVRIEEDAFERMTPYWQRLGFPFDHLVPSLATAIGSSADRPIALAELMGIILNDGVRQPFRRVEELRFAGGTPYETVFEPNPQSGERLMDPEVARALRGVLTGVVQDGTARRLAGVFVDKNGKPIISGGKTGSGDNRYETRSWSRPVSRTGTFVFYIGDRYFGVMTAYVGGEKAGQYAFTSALPVTALKLLAPTLLASLPNL